MPIVIEKLERRGEDEGGKQKPQKTDLETPDLET